MALADRVAVLVDGTLQQADRPQTVYERPANRRVASFFGSPPMNLLEGLIVAIDGRLAFRAVEGTVLLPLPAEVAGNAAVGQTATLGVRPEDLSLRAEAGPDRLVMVVVLVEPTGNTCLVTLQGDGFELTALSGRQTALDGQSVKVVFDMDRAHLFDGATGQALGHGSRIG